MVIFYQSTSCGLSRVIDEFSSGAVAQQNYTHIYTFNQNLISACMNPSPKLSIQTQDEGLSQQTNASK
jgi:hypothetical protein